MDMPGAVFGDSCSVWADDRISLLCLVDDRRVSPIVFPLRNRSLLLRSNG